MNILSSFIHRTKNKALLQDWVVKYWQSVAAVAPGKNALSTGEVLVYDDHIALPCTGGGECLTRSITLNGHDAKKPILVPVLTSVTSNSASEGERYDELVKRSKTRTITPKAMEVSVDGKQLMPSYVQTGEFNIQVPDDHMLEGSMAGSFRSASTGYWRKLESLSAGSHVVTFGGTMRNGFHTRVQYHIDVEK